VIAIKPRKTVLYASWGVLAFGVIWGIASSIAFALQCSPNRWAMGPSEENTCVDQYMLQIVVRSCDAANDLAIIALPIAMMRTVQTSRWKRWVVIGLFGLRVV
jgi:hypothetical protein